MKIKNNYKKTFVKIFLIFLLIASTNSHTASEGLRLFYTECDRLTAEIEATPGLSPSLLSRSEKMLATVAKEINSVEWSQEIFTRVSQLVQAIGKKTLEGDGLSPEADIKQIALAFSMFPDSHKDARHPVNILGLSNTLLMLCGQSASRTSGLLTDGSHNIFLPSILRSLFTITDSLHRTITTRQLREVAQFNLAEHGIAVIPPSMAAEFGQHLICDSWVAAEALPANLFGPRPPSEVERLLSEYGAISDEVGRHIEILRQKAEQLGRPLTAEDLLGDAPEEKEEEEEEEAPTFPAAEEEDPMLSSNSPRAIFAQITGLVTRGKKLFIAIIALGTATGTMGALFKRQSNGTRVFDGGLSALMAIPAIFSGVKVAGAAVIALLSAWYTSWKIKRLLHADCRAERKLDQDRFRLTYERHGEQTLLKLKDIKRVQKEILREQKADKKERQRLREELAASVASVTTVAQGTKAVMDQQFKAIMDKHQSAEGIVQELQALVLQCSDMALHVRDGVGAYLEGHEAQLMDAAISRGVPQLVRDDELRRLEYIVAHHGRFGKGKYKERQKVTQAIADVPSEALVVIET
ncbi:hypothetical protein HN446_00585 [bacterium]|jgi:hypothetical protein|nr:hypothetical protein [bacterium]